MREYNLIKLKDEEAKALQDLSNILNEKIEGVPFNKDLDIETTINEFDWNTDYAFWYDSNQVIGLFIGTSDITYFPESIGNLTELRFLNLHQTHFSSFPTTIKNLKKLESIHISYSEESYPETAIEFPDVFQYLDNLQKFSIYGFYEVYLPPSFLKLKNLRELNFYYTHNFRSFF